MNKFTSGSKNIKSKVEYVYCDHATVSYRACYVFNEIGCSLKVQRKKISNEEVNLTVKPSYFYIYRPPPPNCSTGCYLSYSVHRVDYVEYNFTIFIMVLKCARVSRTI